MIKNSAVRQSWRQTRYATFLMGHRPKGLSQAGVSGPNQIQTPISSSVIDRLRVFRARGDQIAPAKCDVGETGFRSRAKPLRRLKVCKLRLFGCRQKIVERCFRIAELPRLKSRATFNQFDLRVPHEESIVIKTIDFGGRSVSPASATTAGQDQGDMYRLRKTFFRQRGLKRFITLCINGQCHLAADVNWRREVLTFRISLALAIADEIWRQSRRPLRNHAEIRGAG